MDILNIVLAIACVVLCIVVVTSIIQIVIISRLSSQLTRTRNNNSHPKRIAASPITPDKFSNIILQHGVIEAQDYVLDKICPCAAISNDKNDDLIFRSTLFYCVIIMYLSKPMFNHITEYEKFRACMLKDAVELYHDKYHHLKSLNDSNEIYSLFWKLEQSISEALEAKSPFLLGGAYRDNVVINTDLFNQVNENLNITNSLIEWISRITYYTSNYIIRAK
jgi:hypothetical protein